MRLILVVWVAVTLTFFALRLLPGDAVDMQLAQSGASQDAISDVRARLGLDVPPLEQYLRYMAGLLRGDLGASLTSGLPVAEMIGQRLPATIVLALSASALATVAGVVVGVVAAYGNTLARLLIDLAIGTPIYWTGTLALVAFTTRPGWLPVVILAFHTMGGLAQMIAVNVREIKDSAYVTAARGKGLPETLILRRHVLRVALLPVLTVGALQTGFLLGGTVITESLFVRSGIGRLLLDSTLRQDYPVVQGIVVLAALVYASLTALADWTHHWLDPRIRR